MWLTSPRRDLNMTYSDLAKYELLTTTILQRRHCDDDSGSNAGLTHLHNARCNMPGPGSLHRVGTRVDTLRPHIVRWCLEYMWQYIVRTNGVGRYPCRRGKKTAEMSQCQPHFYIFGGFVPILLTDLGQIWQETVDLRSTLTCQISFESVYCVTFQEQKTAIMGKFWHLVGFCTQSEFITFTKHKLRYRFCVTWQKYVPWWTLEVVGSWWHFTLTFDLESYCCIFFNSACDLWLDLPSNFIFNLEIHVQNI